MRLIIYDEERLYSEALALLFRRRMHDVVACPSSVEELKEALAGLPDCCLVSADADIDAAIQVIIKLRAMSSSIAIVVLVNIPDRDLMSRAIDAGADGVCLKIDGIAEIETIVQRSIRSRKDSKPARQVALSHMASTAPRQKVPASGALTLTPKEQLVLDELIRGSSTTRIAAVLHVSEATIRTHLQHLFAKFGVHSRLGLVATAVRTDSVRVESLYPSQKTSETA